MAGRRRRPAHDVPAWSLRRAAARPPPRHPRCSCGRGSARGHRRAWLVRRSQRGQHLGHRAPIGGPLLGILGQHLGDELGQLRGRFGAEVAQRRRLVEEHAAEHGHRVPGLEGWLAAQALVEHAAQGEDVGARVGLALAARLLRRHVAGRAHGHPGPGEAARDVGGPGDAEVEQAHPLHVSVLGQEDVRGLDVPVHDAARVRRAERLADSSAQAHRLADEEAPVAQALAQVFARQPLHGQPALALGVGAMRDVADDARVVQVGEQSASRAKRPMPSSSRREDLHRHVVPVVGRGRYTAPCRRHRRTGQLEAAAHRSRCDRSNYRGPGRGREGSRVICSSTPCPASIPSSSRRGPSWR